MVSLKLTVLGQLTMAVISNVVTIKGDENGVQGHIDVSAICSNCFESLLYIVIMLVKVLS